MQKRIEAESKISDLYSHFLLNYLLTSKKEKVKITPVTLRINGFPPNLKELLSKSWVFEFGYVELLKEKDKYLLVKLTNKAYLMADTFEYEHRIIHRNYLIRLFVWINNSIKAVKRFFRLTIPQFFKRLFSIKSGNVLVKAIGILSTTAVLIWTCIQLYQWAVGKGWL